MAVDAGPIEPEIVRCRCGDPQSLHRFGNGVCLRVRNGAPCDCERFEVALEALEPGAERVSLVEQYTVKP